MIDEPVNDPEMVRRYQWGWSQLLQGILSWPKEQADKWAAECMDRCFDSPFLLHEYEWWFVVETMLPPAADTLSSLDRHILCNRVELTFLADLDLLDRPLHDNAWSAARARVRAALVGAGVAEPSFDEQNLA